MSHGDRVESLPDGFRRLGVSDNCPFAAVESLKHKFWGVQFHPEVAHTPRGNEILATFSSCLPLRAQLDHGQISSMRPSRRSSSRSVRPRDSADFRVAWIRPWQRPWYTVRWVTG